MRVPALVRCLLACLAFLGFVQIGDPRVVRAGAPNDPKVRFGVNGHPLNSGSYDRMALDRQLSLLKSIGLRTYRVNINPEHTQTFPRLSELVSLADGEGIRILPVVVISPKEYSDESAAYAAAKTAMYRVAKQSDSRIPVWELGNEYDLYCVKDGTGGDRPADYDPAKYAVVRGLLRGMLDGLRQANPTARSIVETSQHTNKSLDNGFLQRLVDDGVRFDATGYHYYSRDGRIPVTADGRNALQVLQEQFHKSIWVTEFDESSISPNVGPNSDPERQGKALRVAMEELASDADRYHVVNADIYELLDEPQLSDSFGVPANQAQFGILRPDGSPTAASQAVQEFLETYYH